MPASQTAVALSEFDSCEQLADQLAADIEQRINQAIQQKGYACCAFSGGSTPELLFAKLAKLDVNWQRVLMTLVDERLVDESHELSNAAFLKRILAANDPELLESIQFLPLFDPEIDSSDSQGESALRLKVISDWNQFAESYQANTDEQHFDVVILGMGEDGHTASFFPDSENIDSLLDGQSNEQLLFCESPSTQVKRITWSMPMLLNCEFVVLHIHGASKQGVLEQALEAEQNLLPIASFATQYLESSGNALPVYYAN